MSAARKVQRTVQQAVDHEEFHPVSVAGNAQVSVNTVGKLLNGDEEEVGRMRLSTIEAILDAVGWELVVRTKR